MKRNLLASSCLFHVPGKWRLSRSPHTYRFFDLIVVAMLRQLSEKVAEDYRGVQLALFVVLFWPVFSLWNDIRHFLNVSGVDDIPQRLFIVFYMGLMLGYSVNAATLTVPSAGESNEESESSVAEMLSIASPDGITSFAAESDIEHIETPPFATLRATILFLIAAKLARLIQLAIYGASLPRFRTAYLQGVVKTLSCIAIYLPLVWVRNETAFWILMALGAAHEFFLRLASALVIRWQERDASHVIQEERGYRPALNLPHHM